MGAVAFTKSLWNDPFRWALVKSIVVFGMAVYVAREMEAADAAEAAEAAAGQMMAT